MDHNQPEAKFPFHGTHEGGTGQSVCFTLSQLGLENARQFGDLVGALGLEPRHFAVLRAVHAEEGQSQQVIGDHLGIPASTMVAIVDHLESAGLLERRLRASDRRTRTLHLTVRGDELQTKAFATAMQHEARVCAGLEPGEREQLLALLRRLSINLGVSASTLPDRGSGVRPSQAQG